MPVESNWDSVIGDLEALMGSLPSELSEAVETRTSETTEAIRNDWPSSTGASAAAWTYSMTGELDSIIENDLEYASFINDGDAEAESAAIFEDEMGDSFAEELETLTAASLDAV